MARRRKQRTLKDLVEGTVGSIDDASRRVARLHTEAVSLMRSLHSNGETEEARKAVMLRLGEVLAEMTTTEPLLLGSFLLNYLYTTAVLCTEYYAWFVTYKLNQEKYTGSEKAVLYYTLRHVMPIDILRAATRGSLVKIHEDDEAGHFAADCEVSKE